MKTFIALILTVICGLGAEIHLAWDANTEPDLGGYVLYDATDAAGTNFEQVLRVGLVTNCVYIANPGDHNFAMTATNISGLESDLSNTVKARIAYAPANVILSYNRTTKLMMLTWSPNDPKDAVTAYTVYEIIGQTNFVPIATLQTNLYQFAPLKGVHLLCVSARNGFGESPFSVTVKYGISPVKGFRYGG